MVVSKCEQQLSVECPWVQCIEQVASILHSNPDPLHRLPMPELKRRYYSRPFNPSLTNIPFELYTCRMQPRRRRGSARAALDLEADLRQRGDRGRRPRPEALLFTALTRLSSSCSSPRRSFPRADIDEDAYAFRCSEEENACELDD